VRVSLIVAVAANGVIGRAGGLPWRLSADLRRFKALTMGHHLVMGRRTWESIGRPLPGRTTIVVTRREDLPVEGALVARSPDDALRLAAGDDEVFVVGGAELYRALLDRADRIYLTRVHAEPEGDTHSPPVDWTRWRRVGAEDLPAGPRDDHPSTFEIWERREPT
jgi:dihydrofolate reductase